MNFTFASQPELLRQSQKDDQFAFELFGKLLDTLQTLPALQYRNLIRFRSELRALSTLVYYATNRKTLGEEYTSLRQFNQSDFDGVGLPVSRTRTLAFVLISALGPYMIAQTKPRYQTMQVNNPRANIPDFETVVDRLSQLRLALFFIAGHYYEIPKMITNIYHIFTRHPPTHGITYKLIGKLLLAKLFVEFATFTYQRLRRKTAPILQSALSADQTTLSCQLCFDKATDASCTPCGHVFCWQCLIPYASTKAQCPSCRSACPPNRVVRLLNFN